MKLYVSTLNCEYTDPLALHAIEMIHDNLKKSYEGDMACRDKMHDAQCLAGMAFSNALLGIVHSMAHKTGAAFTGGHIIHGCANAMYLPKVIKYNSKDPVAAERYAKIAKFINLKGETTEELVDALIAELRSMNDQLNIPQGIKNYGPGGVKADESIIDEKEFLEKLPEVAKNAIADACTGSQPTPAKSGRNGKTSQGLLLRYRNRLLIRLTNLFVLITALRFRGAVFYFKMTDK